MSITYVSNRGILFMPFQKDKKVTSSYKYK